MRMKPNFLQMIRGGRKRFLLLVKNMNKQTRFKLILILSILFLTAPILSFSQNLTDRNISGFERTAEDLSKEWNGESIRRSIDLFKNIVEFHLQSERFAKASKSLNRIAELEDILGNYEAAVLSLQRALEIENKNRLENERAETYSQLLLISQKTGKISDIKKYLVEVQRSGLHSPDSAVKAKSLFALAEYFYNQRDFQNAVEHYQSSIENWKNVPDPENEAFVLIYFSYVYMATGEVFTGLEKAKEAEELFIRTKNKRGLALTHIAIGHLYNSIDKKQKAMENYKKAEKSFPDNMDFIENARLLNGIGLIYEDFGEFRQSLNYRQRAFELFEKESYLQGQLATLPSLVKLCYLSGNQDLASAYYVRTQTLSKLLEEEFYLAVTQKQIGDYFFEVQEDEKASEYYKKALDILKKFRSDIDYALIQNNLGKIYVRRGELKPAEKQYKEALQINRKVQDKFAEGETLYNLANLRVLENKFGEALRIIEESVGLTEDLSSDVNNSILSRTYFSSVFDRYELYINLLIKMHRKFPEKNFAAKALLASEKSRSRTILETLLLSEADFTADADPRVIERTNELNSRLSIKSNQLTRLISSNASQTEIDTLQNELRIVENELEEIKGELKNKSPIYSAIKNPAPFDLEGFQKNMLDENSLLLEFAFGKEESYVWLIGKKEFEVFVLPKREVIEDRIEILREMLVYSRNKKPSEEIAEYQKRIYEAETKFETEAGKLSGILFGQFAGKLKDKRLIIVPDGKLGYFPVSALPFPGGREPFLVSNEIVYVPSASTLNLLRTKSKSPAKPPKDFLVFADPVYSADDDRFKGDRNVAAKQTGTFRENFRSMDLLLSLQRLPASREEADAILETFGTKNSGVLADFAANRKSFAEAQLSEYKVLHFATHGYLNEDRPELSGIVLSKFDEKGSAQDGFIRLQDIYGLNLSADLVVLSACDTGLGKEVKGEGLMSLTNGFLQVGAQTVVSSRWKVDDNATLELMKDFYKNLAGENTTPAAALRKAQIKMYRESAYRSPFYWAAFTVQGEYQNKPELSKSFDYFRYSLIIIAIFVLFGFFQSLKSIRQKIRN